MTKQEARLIMQSGKCVTHPAFGYPEALSMINGNIVNAFYYPFEYHFKNLPEEFNDGWIIAGEEPHTV